MLIKKLTLYNFRNYEDESFSFTEGLNILTGRNAQGKTNCAEAVFYLCTGASLRIRHEKQLIRHGQEFARIAAVAESRFGNVSLEAKIYENKRELYVNGNKLTRQVDFLGNMNCVFFSPGELRLIQDGPDERRRFLDISISQTSRDYCISLNRYRKVLDQRNNLLKERDFNLVLETLPVWDEQFARYAARVVKKRREYLAELSPLAGEAHAFLTDGAEALSLGIDGSYPAEEQGVYEKILKEISSSRERDMRLGFTSVGPHRDDLRVTINGTDARAFASQGQARTAALSLKLAETELFRRYAGEAPVLILDDVMSELDLPRRKKLLDRVKGLQCILTCTHAERVLYGAEANRMRIQNGRILP
ncbi:MAG: DNA replication/repair protein RecF [Clostridia bacterium]|nr:DNA replication/repair protein RecF [Clostridia bacterium]